MYARAFAIVAIAGFSISLPAQARSPMACDRQVVMQIDSAKISVEPDGVSIDAFGVAESAGWSNATLVLVGAISDGTAMAEFVACRPEVSAQVLTPIEGHALLDLSPDVRTIIIRAKANTMTVELTR